MSEAGLAAKTKRRFRVVTTDSNHKLPLAANILDRQFSPAEPGAVLASNITYIATMALGRTDMRVGAIHHSDRGSQYAANEFRKLLAAKQLRQSMSRKGNCWDNAPTESFFHTLKTEHIYFESFATKEEARESIFEYIEVFYNRERLHSTLGYKSPVDFEKEFAKCA